MAKVNESNAGHGRLRARTTERRRRSTYRSKGGLPLPNKKAQKEGAKQNPQRCRRKGAAVGASRQRHRRTGARTEEFRTMPTEKVRGLRVRPGHITPMGGRRQATEGGRGNRAQGGAAGKGGGYRKEQGERGPKRSRAENWHDETERRGTATDSKQNTRLRLGQKRARRKPQGQWKRKASPTSDPCHRGRSNGRRQPTQQASGARKEPPPSACGCRGRRVEGSARRQQRTDRSDGWS